jgi:hypothetical protein
MRTCGLVAPKTMSAKPSLSAQEMQEGVAVDQEISPMNLVTSKNLQKLAKFKMQEDAFILQLPVRLLGFMERTWIASVNEVALKCFSSSAPTF